MLKITLIAVIGLITVTLFREFRMEYSLPVTLAIIICLSNLLVPNLLSIIDDVKDFSELNSNNTEIITDLLKLVGISYVRNFGHSLCSDYGCKSIAFKIDIGARISSLIIVLPRLKALYVNIIKLL